MKVLCPHCERMVELERFRLEGATLRVTCGRCGQETAVEAAVSTPSAAPAVGAPDVAPAPVTPPPVRAESSASRPPSQPPRVALASSPTASNVVMLRTASVEAVERAGKAAEGDPFEVPAGLCPKCLSKRTDAPECPQCGVVFQVFQPDNLSPPQWLREAWRELLRDWGNEAAHESLRLRAQAQDALTLLGRLYRLRLAVEPADPIAEKGRSDVLRLAAAPMAFRSRADEPAPGGKVRPLTIGVVVVVAGGCVWFIMRFLLQNLVPSAGP